MNKNSDLRRALISFSCTWLAFITLMAIISLFSIWSMNRAYEKSWVQQSEIAELENHALKAQIAFKIQVQEWKNILLRGYREVDRANHFTAFEENEAKMQSHLQSIDQLAAARGLPSYSKSARQILAQHQSLGQNYRDALDGTSDLTPIAARQADDLVRGKDRSLEASINQLANEVSTELDQRLLINLEQLNARYLTLRNFITISVIIVLVLTAASLYGVLRATAKD